MEHTYRKRAEAFLKRHGKKRIWHGALTAMAAVVVFITSYMLILPAITLSQEPVCGLEAHTHTAQCNPLYDEETGGWIYSCGLEAHVHTDACYPQAEPEPVYYCGLDEHVHGADCYKLDTLICMQTEHIHGAECLQPTDNKQGMDAASGQTTNAFENKNTGSVMTSASVAALRERTRTPNIPETEDKIPQDYPSISGGDFSVSSGNPSVSGGNVSVSGGDPGVSGGDPGVSGGNPGWTGESHWQFEGAKSFSDGNPEIFEESVSGSDYAAVIQEGSEELRQGDPAGEESLSAAELDGEIMSDDEIVTILANKEDPSMPGTTTPLTGVKATGTGTTYDAAADRYDTDLTLEFVLSKDTIDNNNGGFKIKLPKGVDLPTTINPSTGKTLLDGGPYRGYDSNNPNVPGFYYWFVQEPDGTYSIVVDFIEEYMETVTGTVLDCYIAFDGWMQKVNREDGKLHFGTAEDEVHIDISVEEITYPDNEREEYNIDVQKSGSYLAGSNKLRYQVTVTSTKGTPDEVVLRDTLTAQGLDIAGMKVVSVRKETFDQYGNTQSTEDITNYSAPTSTDPKEFELSLPKLGERERYIVEYEYEIATEISADYSYSAENKVKVSSEIPGEGDIWKETELSVKVEKNVLGKTGWYDAAKGQIQWTITVNQSGTDIAGAELTDEMFAGLTEEELRAAITPTDGFEILKNPDGTVKGLKFTGETNYNKYEIKYSTKVTAGWEKQEVTNSAQLTGEQVGTNGVTSSVPVQGGDVEKKVESVTDPYAGDSFVINWESRVKVPASGFPASTENPVTVTDVLNLTCYGANNDIISYMSWQQIKNFVDSIKDKAWFKNGVTLDHLKVVYYEKVGGRFEQKYISYNELQEDIEGAQAAFQKDTSQFAGFQFEFVGGLGPDVISGGEIVLRYQSTALTGNVETDQAYKNAIDVEGRSREASYPYKKRVVKLDKNFESGSTTPKMTEDGKISWNVRVVFDHDLTTMTITDTLPAGVTLQDLSYGFDQWNRTSFVLEPDGTDPNKGTIRFGDDANGLGGIVCSGSNYEKNADGTTTVTIKLMLVGENRPGWFAKDKEFWVTYTGVVDGISSLKEGETHSAVYTNKVSVSVDSDAGYGSAEQSQNVTYEKKQPEKKIVSKDGEWDIKDGRVNYSVTINPEGKNLIDSDEEPALTLEDEVAFVPFADYMSSAGGNVTRTVELLPETVKLYEIDASGNEKEVSAGKWRWEYSERVEPYAFGKQYNKITAHVPDETRLVLKYSYRVKVDYPEWWYGQQLLDLSNTAKLTGVTGGEDTHNTSEYYGTAGTTGGVRTQGYIFYKVDENNFDIVLEGAEFTLYKYNAETGTYEPARQEGKIKKYISNEKGTFSVEWQKSEEDYQFEENTMYYVVETKAPSGYELPKEQPDKYYFYFSGKEDTDESWKNDDFANAVDLNERSYTAYCRNHATPKTEITVEKKWVDPEGNELEQSDGEVYFQLWRKEQEGVIVEPYVSQSGKAELTSNSSDYNYKKLELDYSDGTLVKLELKYSFNETWSNPPSAVKDPQVIVARGNLGQIIGISNRNITANQVGGEHSGSLIYYVPIYSDTHVQVQFLEDPDHLWIWNTIVVSSAGESTDSGTTATPDEPGSRYGRETYVISKKDGWSKTITDLPLAGTDSKGKTVVYSYYVVEVDKDGNPISDDIVSYENNDGIFSGTITVTNIYSGETYELPMTGGAGTRLYTLGGLFATALAGLLLYRKSRGKEERFSS